MLALIRRLSRHSRWIVRFVQLAIFIAAGFSAFLLRFDLCMPGHYLPYLKIALCAWVFAKVLVFQLLHMDRSRWCYVSTLDLLRLAIANVAGSILGGLAIVAFGPPDFPRSLYVLDLLLCSLLTATARVVARAGYEVSKLQNTAAGKRTLIYGAGDAGVALLREIRQNPTLLYDVVGFIDDNPRKTGSFIQRTRILGTGDNLPALVQDHAVETVLIAVPSATGSEMAAILDRCCLAGVSYKTIPGLGEVIESVGLASQIRDVAVEDLLGRNPVRLEDRQIRDSLQGRIVLVTGAAGSIGSELCRQIARFNPAGIVGFEIAESPLFEIDREMRQAFPNVPFYPEIGSIQNRTRLNEVFYHYRPSVVYHAAAYKHVPLMEAHVFEAIENNVFGTLNVALVADEYGVQDFVMISSDKAVRPTNVMGATKRVAELLLLALQNGHTKYVAVRFGNVLGSNGSVIPIFKKQIAAGGPVTVTHPEMRRFFMTIPEACQLVLQAGVVGKGGQVCVLDMGQPVRIIDLAHNLILLSGLRPDRDIPIEFTGMRPGEKLYEELSGITEETVPTRHEKIRIYTGNGVPESNIMVWLDGLREICGSRDVGRLVLALKEMVLDYSPSAHILKRVIDAKPRAEAAAG